MEDLRFDGASLLLGLYSIPRTPLYARLPPTRLKKIGIAVEGQDQLVPFEMLVIYRNQSIQSATMLTTKASKLPI